jgi:hypothetical protein
MVACGVRSVGVRFIMEGLIALREDGWLGLGSMGCRGLRLASGIVGIMGLRVMG